MQDIEIEFLKESNAIEGEFSSEVLDDAVEAWKFMIRQKRLDMLDVLRCHGLLMQRRRSDIAGKLRTLNVRVGRWVAPDASLVGQLLNSWFSNYAQIDEEEGIKRGHIAFEQIHPFEDGNGRVGRIIMNWQRVKAGLPIMVIKENDRFEYYKWFK